MRARTPLRIFIVLIAIAAVGLVLGCGAVATTAEGSDGGDEDGGEPDGLDDGGEHIQGPAKMLPTEITGHIDLLFMFRHHDILGSCATAPIRPLRLFGWPREEIPGFEPEINIVVPCEDDHPLELELLAGPWLFHSIEDPGARSECSEMAWESEPLRIEIRAGESHEALLELHLQHQGDDICGGA